MIPFSVPSDQKGVGEWGERAGGQEGRERGGGKGFEWGRTGGGTLALRAHCEPEATQLLEHELGGEGM